MTTELIDPPTPSDVLVPHELMDNLLRLHYVYYGQIVMRPITKHHLGFGREGRCSQSYPFRYHCH